MKEIKPKLEDEKIENPELSNVAELVEAADNNNLDVQLLEDTSKKVLKFNETFNSSILNLETDAQSGHLGLDANEITEVKESQGIQSALERIKYEAKNLQDSFNLKVLDLKMHRILNKSQRFDELDIYELGKYLKDLTAEQIRMYPEIVNAAEKNLINELKKYTEHNIFSLSDRDVVYLNTVAHAFANQPEIIQELYNSEEVKELQVNIFLNALHSVHFRDIKKLINAIHMDFPTAQEMGKEEIQKTIFQHAHRINGLKYVYDKSNAIEELELSEETKEELVLLSLKEIFSSSYPYPSKNDLRDFGLTSGQSEDFLIRHNSYLIIESIKAMAGENNDHEGWSNYIEIGREGLGIDLSFDNIKKVLNSSPEKNEILKQMVLKGAKNGKIYSPLVRFAYEELGDKSILNSSEGQKAFQDGFLQILERDPNDALDKWQSIPEFDMSQLIGDKRVEEVLANYIQNNLKNSSYFQWPKNVFSKFELDENKFKELSIDGLAERFKEVDYNALSIYKDLQLNSEQQEKLAISVFGSDKYVKYFKNVLEILTNINDKQFFKHLISNPERFSQKSPEDFRVYFEISSDINNSPSQEILRIKEELIEQIIATDNPKENYQKIKDIFIQNNLPLVGKVQRIFEVLHPSEKLESKITSDSSPVLQEATPKRRKQIIFEDLLKVHIENNNRSLKKFLQLIDQADSLVSKLAEDNLTEDEKEKLGYILSKLQTVSDVSQRGQKYSSNDKETSDKSLQEQYAQVKEQLGAKEGQNLSDRVIEMYARPLGYEKAQEVLKVMDSSVKNADARNRESVKGKLTLENGDFIKGVEAKYISNILQNGSVAKEFLGSDSSQDQTPFDTDIELITNIKKSQNFSQRYNEGFQIARTYGEIKFVIKDRGQFQRTDSQNPPKYDPEHFELFKSTSETHYGIRTGFPCTEIDFMISDNTSEITINNLGFEIAKNGYYIPVLSNNGELLFKPDQFDAYRKVFDGITEFDGANMKYKSSESDNNSKELKSFQTEVSRDAERMVKLRKEINDKIVSVLEKFNIKLKGNYDDSLVGAELLDIGSTGRGTNMPGEGDFDFNLKLDAKDFYKYPEIAHAIVESLGTYQGEQPIMPGSGNNYQMRFFGSNSFSQPNIDIDIGFINKSDINVYASHDAVRDKLQNIRENFGENAYQDVVANILLAKQWLKEGKAYKKGNYGEGGLGGIGVENWILANEGNLHEAMVSFNKAAHNADGSVKPFAEFLKDYPILDAGLNLRYNNHDNFVKNMTSEGYENMVKVVERQL